MTACLKEYDRQTDHYLELHHNHKVHSANLRTFLTYLVDPDPFD